ncbi:MAG: DUF6433 family protein [bacterium]
MKTTIPQVFEEVDKAGSRAEKIRLLRAYDRSEEWPYGKMLRAWVNINFNARINWGLPEGWPMEIPRGVDITESELKPMAVDRTREIGYTESNLFQEYRRLNVWLDEIKRQSHFENGVQNPHFIPRMKREELFIEMLKAIHWTEAEFVVAVKDRKLTHLYPSLTPELIQEAWPGFFVADFAYAKIPDAKKVEAKAKAPRTSRKKASGAGSAPSLSQVDQTPEMQLEQSQSL